ncbi:SLF1 protein, partial [Jacana jacana]|nr:SLF1 protein [Jacana jacana]
QMASGSQKRVVQFTGFNKREKAALLEWLFRLDCVFLHDKKYRNCTHLIAKKPSKSEKFLAACAAGKWVLTKKYVINSAKSGRWLDETTYEWGYESGKDTHCSPQRHSAPKRWREGLARSGAPGAFHRWRVVLPAKYGDKRVASIRRVLQAGRATICSSKKADCDVSHVFILNKICPVPVKKRLPEARYYSVKYLGDYLFENEMENSEDTQMNHLLAVQETKQIVSNMQLAAVKNAVIKHMYFAVVSNNQLMLPSCKTCIAKFAFCYGVEFLTSVFYHSSHPLTAKLETGSPLPPYREWNTKGLMLPPDSFDLVCFQILHLPCSARVLKSCKFQSRYKKRDAVPITSEVQQYPGLYTQSALEASLHLLNPRQQRSSVLLLTKIPHSQVENTPLSRGTWHMLEGLMEEYLLPDVITELAAGQKYSTPPVQLLHFLLEYVLLGSTDAVFYAKLHHALCLVLRCDPPWKSSSMLKYYTDLLQCPICKKGTWSFLEMLVRSCLYCKSVCHAVPVSGRGDEPRIFHKTLLKFFFDVVKAEVEFLTKSLVEGTNSQHQQVMPQTVLLKTFWLGGETSVLFTKHVNILADWVVLSHRELTRKNDAFTCEIAGLLNALLGTVVEYWIISSLLMNRNMFCQVADDLAHYIAISCDVICSIPSLWLQMFVAEAVFKKMCLQRNIAISEEPLSLQKIVCCYLPALREVGMVQKAKKMKTGQWLCPESQRALQMLNGDKQNQVKVLPDLPDLLFSKRRPLTRKLRTRSEAEASYTKKNRHVLAEEVHFNKRNIKGETALHTACIRNKVEKLIQLLSFPGIDINVKDYAGWTPLHEACNHGSTVCVREILQRCPEVDLLSQVDGVTPLHDALSNGHVEIGKLLLQHGGPVLLQQRDSNGKLPLDYVESAAVQQELLNVVHPEESIDSFCERTEQDFCSQQGELWLILFNKMLLNFCSVYNLSSPFTVTLREVASSNALPVTAPDNHGMKDRFSADWLVDIYFRELETFQKLPQFLEELSANMLFFPGEQMNALLATLETMVEAYRLF